MTNSKEKKLCINFVLHIVSKILNQALQSCADQHDAVIKGDIPWSLQALRSGDYKFSERGTMDAAVEASPCEKNSQPDAGRPFLT